MELNVQQNEYISALAPDAGVRVLVHARGTYPAVEDNGVSIPVGTVTSIGLSTVNMIRHCPFAKEESCSFVFAFFWLLKNRVLLFLGLSL